MAGYEIGTAYVTVMPSMRGFVKTMTNNGGIAGQSSGTMFSNAFSSIVKGSAIGTALGNAVSSAATKIGASFGAAVSRFDTIQNFPKVMSNLGYSSADAAASIQRLSDGVRGMPTRLNSIVDMTQQLAPLTGGLDQATTLSLAFNDALLATGKGTADQARAMEQYTQMLAKGKPDMQSWRTMQEVMPAQLNQVAKALLGATANSQDLYEALENGTISFDDFNDAIMRLDKEGVDGFSSFRDQAVSATQGIGTAMENVGAAIEQSWTDVFAAIGQENISGFINDISASIRDAGKGIGEFVSGIMGSIDVDGFKKAFGDMGDAVDRAFDSDSPKTFGKAIGDAINGFKPVVEGATPVVEALARAFNWVAKNAGWLVPLIIAVVLAIKGFQAVSFVAGIISAIGGAAAAATPALSASVPELLALGGAALMVGAGVVLACAGIALLAFTAIQLAEAGPMAALAMVGLVLAIAALAVVFAALGPALDVAAPAMLAFGIAVLAVGVGVALAALGITLLAGALPGLAQYGLAAAVAFAQLGAGIAAFGAGALMGGVGAIVLGLGLLAVGAGALVASVGVLALAVGVLALGVGMMLVAASVMIVASGMALLGGVLPAVASGSLMAGPALVALGVAAGTASVALAASAPGLGAFAAAAGLAAGAAWGLGSSQGELASQTYHVNEAASAAQGSIGVMRGAMDNASSASNYLGSNLNQLPGIANSAAGSFDGFAGHIHSAMDGAVSAVVDGMNRIRAAVNVNLTIPTIRVAALPHFSMRGSFNPENGSVPSVGVSYYAHGGIFKHMSVFGENGRETVTPLTKQGIRPWAEALDEMSGGRGGTTVYIDGARINDDPQIREITKDYLIGLHRYMQMG